jgi:hypothetical protein
VTVWETTGWRGHEGEVVTVVSRDEIGRLLGVRGPEVQRRLRVLRDADKLICDKGRLTKRLRIEDPSARYGRRHERVHVLRGSSNDFRPPRGKARVILL